MKKVRTKAFFANWDIDEQINNYLEENQDIKVVDIKITQCENTYYTQAYLMALLIYEQVRDVGKGKGWGDDKESGLSRQVARTK